MDQFERIADRLLTKALKSRPVKFLDGSYRPIILGALREALVQNSHLEAMAALRTYLKAMGFEHMPDANNFDAAAQDAVGRYFGIVKDYGVPCPKAYETAAQGPETDGEATGPSFRIATRDEHLILAKRHDVLRRLCDMVIAVRDIQEDPIVYRFLRDLRAESVAAVGESVGTNVLAECREDFHADENWKSTVAKDIHLAFSEAHQSLYSNSRA